MIKHELYLGHSLPSGAMVPVHEFREFMIRVVEPRVPSYTLTTAVGRVDGISEVCSIITVFRIDTDDPAQFVLWGIAREYAIQFRQSETLYVQSLVTGDSWPWRHEWHEPIEDASSGELPQHLLDEFGTRIHSPITTESSESIPAVESLPTSIAALGMTTKEILTSPGRAAELTG